MKIIYLLSNLVLIIMSIFSCFLFFNYGAAENTLKFMVITILILGFTVISYCLLKGIKQHFTLFAFTMTFLIFNLGFYLVDINNHPFGYITFSSMVRYSLLDEAKGFFIMYLGLLCYYVSYRVFIKKFDNKNKVLRNKLKMQLNKDSNQYLTIRKISKIAMYFGAIFAFIKLGLKVYNSITYGYTSIYLDSGVYNLTVLNLFDDFFELGFFAFLITLPPIKECKFSIALYLFYAVISLLSGGRTLFVVSILVLIYYFVKRDIKLEQNYISKKKLILLCVFGIIIIGLMPIIDAIRKSYGGEDFQISFNSYFDLILSAFEQLGFSGKIIPLVISDENQLVELGRNNALFYPIINYFKNNAVFRIFGKGALLTQTYESLKNTYTLGGWLTYINWKEAYLSGAGVGTNYLAESYLWGGSIGVIIINIIFGYLFTKLDNFKFNSWKMNLLCLMAFSILLHTPRASALEIIPESVMLLIFILFLTLISEKRKQSYYKNKLI